MTFEEWWEENGYNNYYGDHTKKITQYAWSAATAAERQRCLDIADRHAQWDVIAKQIKDEIGE